MARYALTMRSGNGKTGPIPVSTTSRHTCPNSCPFKGGVCYAENGPLRLHWDRLSNGLIGMELPQFLEAVRRIPRGQLWRHNQAGDLPGDGESINIVELAQLAQANKGRRGFTYTHYPLNSQEEQDAVRQANADGFTINLSANNLQHADELAALNVGPVVVVVAEDAPNTMTTPGGRKVVVCPAVRNDGVSCATCQVCQKANRKAIIAFPVHGARKRQWVGG